MLLRALRHSLRSRPAAQLDAREEHLAAWTCCRLTRQALGCEEGGSAVVACQLGFLYQREALLQALKAHLVDGVPLPALVSHVGSLKDVTTLRLSAAESAPGDGGSADAAHFTAATRVRFACPLTALPMNGRYRFVALRPSGVVVSERALRTAPEAVEELLGGPTLAQQTVLLINAPQEEVMALREADAACKAARRAKKAAKRAEPPPPQKDTAAAAPPPAKRFKASEHLPAGATAEVYNSIFTSSVAKTAETYGARALSHRR